MLWQNGLSLERKVDVLDLVVICEDVVKMVLSMRAAVHKC
jgi:hypothetical protein